MRRRRKKHSLHLDIAPINLIDLLLVLLIFFVTTTSFLQLKVIDISLPNATNQKVIYKKDHTYVVSIDKECKIFFDKSEVSLVELKSRFKDVLEDKKHLVQIGADKDSKHSCFIDVLDTAKAVGIENLGILTKLKS